MAASPQPSWPPQTQSDLDAAAQSQALKPQIAASPGSLLGGALTNQLLDYLPIAGSLLPILAAVRMKKAPRPWDSARGLKDFLEEVQTVKAGLPKIGGGFEEQFALMKVLKKRGIEGNVKKEIEALSEATVKWTRSERTAKTLAEEPGVQTLIERIKPPAFKPQRINQTEPPSPSETPFLPQFKTPSVPVSSDPLGLKVPTKTGNDPVWDLMGKVVDQTPDAAIAARRTEREARVAASAHATAARWLQEMEAHTKAVRDRAEAVAAARIAAKKKE